MTEAQKARHWVTQIDRIIDKKKFRWAKDTLKSIKAYAEENERITQKQIEAIKNIRYGKNRMGNY